MARLTAEELADTSRYQFAEEELDLPELGGSVLIRQPSVAQREQILDLPLGSKDRRKRIRATATMLAITMVDPAMEADDLERILRGVPAPAVDRLFNSVNEKLGIADEDEEERSTLEREFRPEDD